MVKIGFLGVWARLFSLYARLLLDPLTSRNTNHKRNVIAMNAEGPTIQEPSPVGIIKNIITKTLSQLRRCLGLVMPFLAPSFPFTSLFMVSSASLQL